MKEFAIVRGVRDAIARHDAESWDLPAETCEQVLAAKRCAHAVVSQYREAVSEHARTVGDARPSWHLTRCPAFIGAGAAKDAAIAGIASAFAALREAGEANSRHEVTRHLVAAQLIIHGASAAAVHSACEYTNERDALRIFDWSAADARGAAKRLKQSRIPSFDVRWDGRDGVKLTMQPKVVQSMRQLICGVRNAVAPDVQTAQPHEADAAFKDVREAESWNDWQRQSHPDAVRSRRDRGAQHPTRYEPQPALTNAELIEKILRVYEIRDGDEINGIYIGAHDSCFGRALMERVSEVIGIAPPPLQPPC